ncbi:hypothetical protein AACH06_07595 [Ideonella sp. DXS29W]|uniref:Uncharacterized protein n=1 Tax=Ideonella lacteola TaxID=2984193 RepID=A0ABU9BQ92_9BURK
MARLLRDAVDLRAFALEARRHPEAGGYFYAARAMAECRLHPAAAADGEGEGASDPMTVDAEPGGSHRRLQALAAQHVRWARRCASFLPQELSDAAMAALWRDARQSADPLAALLRRWQQAVLADDARALHPIWQAIVATGEPALLDGAATQAGGLFGATLREVDPAGEDTRRVDRQQVWAAVICEMGGGCTPPHGPADSLCAALPGCARERWDTDAEELPAGHKLASTVGEVQHLLQAFQRGEAPPVGALALAWP